MILLVDAAHAIRRCLHVPNLRSMHSDSGIPTGAIYGFFNSLQITLKELPINDVIVFFEGGHSERRKRLYPIYKQKPSDLDQKDEHGMTNYEAYRHAVNWVSHILFHLGVQTISVRGKEGDDSVYMASRIFKSRHPVTVLSEDSDFAMYVEKDFMLYKPIKRVLISPLNFADATGHLSPQHLMWFKCIVGEGQKNCEAPGIKGVGQGTAKKILNKISPEDLCPKEIIRISAEFPPAKAKNATTRYEKVVDAGEAFLLKNRQLVDLEMERFTLTEVQAMIAYLETQPKNNFPKVCQVFESLSIRSHFYNNLISAITRLTRVGPKVMNRDFIRYYIEHGGRFL